MKTMHTLQVLNQGLQREIAAVLNQLATKVAHSMHLLLVNSTSEHVP